MGILARVLSYVSRDVKVDRGGGSNLTAQHFSSPQDDAAPLPNDYVMLSDPRGAGRQGAIGYYSEGDDKQKANPGEKRIYSRSEDGNVVSEIWLKNDGSISMSSTADIEINGVKITPQGNIVTPSGVILNTHNHAQDADSRGDTEQDTKGPKNA